MVKLFDHMNTGDILFNQYQNPPIPNSQRGVRFQLDFLFLTYCRRKEEAVVPNSEPEYLM